MTLQSDARPNSPVITATRDERPHRETLWMMHHGSRRVTAEVVCVDGAWELRLFSQSVQFLWHRCNSYDDVVRYSEMIGRDLRDEHWRDA